MEKLINKQNLLDHIRTSEGIDYECDDEAIITAYKNREENQSSLAIKILSILGGFLATLAGLGFLALAGLYDSEIGLIIVGVLCTGGAIGLNKNFDKLIIDTFSISIYVSGLALIAFGLMQMNVSEYIIALISCVIAVCSMRLTQNFMLSFISIITISTSFLSLIFINNSHELIHLYVTGFTLLLAFFFLNEARIISYGKKLSRLYNPIRIGLVISLLFGLIIIGVKDIIRSGQSHFFWLSPIVLILVTLYIIHLIIKTTEIEAFRTKTLLFVLSSIILLATIFSPAISGAIIIILLSYMVNYKTGLAIGIISMIYFISQYYYDLSLTLLTKSILLFVSGIVFLLLYVLTSKMLASNEEI